jgi:monovalent cation/hydrogen antiporter
VAGVLLAKFYMWATKPIKDIPTSVLLQFIGTFAVWLLADRLGLSAILTVILTVIAFAMTAARHAPGRIDARERISSYAVWDVAVFVLNVLAFVMIGLQLRGIVVRTPDSGWHTYLVCAVAVCVTVVLVRILWVLFYSTIVRWIIKSFDHGRQPLTMPTYGGSLIVGWCGMRGIVTLAAALALPDGSATTAFPYRDLIILCAFCVVLTTLVLQGMTLRPLLVWVGLKDDGTVDRETRLARVETARAALRVLEGQPSRPAIDAMRRAYAARMRMEEAQAKGNPGEQTGDELAAVAARVITAQRAALMDLRARWIIGDDAFHAAEEELDLLELTTDARIRPGD